MDRFQKGSVLIISHDSGGAEILSAWIKRLKIPNPVFFLKGPAVGVFQRSGLVDEKYVFTEKWPENASFMLASMSFHDGFTMEMLARGKIRGLTTELVLDSWYDYPARFGFPTSGWEDCLPTNLTVVDNLARSIVESGPLIDHCKLFQIENYYLKNFYQLYRKTVQRERVDGHSLLFLSCPIQESREKGLAEFQRIKTDKKELLADVVLACRSREIPILLRPHPHEDREQLCSAYGHLLDDIALSKCGVTLMDDLKEASIVVGFCSLALIQAVEVGKLTISYAKGDLDEAFGWRKLGVYNHFGIIECNELSSLQLALGKLDV